MEKGKHEIFYLKKELNVGQSQVVLTKNQSMIALTANIPSKKSKKIWFVRGAGRVLVLKI